MTRQEAARLLLERRKARVSFLDFMRYIWWSPHPLVVGKHTREICAAIDDACTKYERGESSFLDIGVPFRHGKSDMVSRALPAYFLGRFSAKQPDVIMSGYGASLVEGFGRDARRIIESEAYQSLFPSVQLSKSVNNAAEWQVAGSIGKVTCAGLGGAITGKGGALIVVDDYCKSREEAESPTFRAKTWDSFTNDLMTRRAPVSIVIVCATPWHKDDIRGRIRRKEAEDKDFPRFQPLIFPATNADGAYLFPERFPEVWYREQYATLGRYGASGLLDCNPIARGGNVFRVDRIRSENPQSWPTGLRWHRCWDMASSVKQRAGDDPDWTCGMLGAVHKERDPVTGASVPHLYLRDGIFMREEAPRRNARIRMAADADGHVPICVEAFGAYKDAATDLAAALNGVRVVRQLRPPGDKMVKAQPLEPIFEAGNVHVPNDAPWVDEWLRHFEEFPSGAHDDAVDATALVWHAQAGGCGILM